MGSFPHLIPATPRGFGIGTLAGYACPAHELQQVAEVWNEERVGQDGRHGCDSSMAVGEVERSDQEFGES